MVRLRDHLVFAWTEPGETARVRMRAIPLSDLGSPTTTVSDGQRTRPKLAVGDAAPALSAQTLDGADVTLASLSGKPVLLNLWATWCEPCRMELRELKKLHQRHADAGLSLVALSVDRDATATQIRAFVERRKLPFAVWHDRNDAASTALALSTLPATFVIDAAGKIAFAHVGAITADDRELTTVLERVLR